MVTTAQPALFDPAEFQRSAAMAAAKKQQSRLPPAVAKGDEIFAEDAHLPGQIGEICRETDRLPVAAHKLAARRPRSDPGQLRIGVRNLESIGAFHNRRFQPLAARLGEPIGSDITILSIFVSSIFPRFEYFAASFAISVGSSGQIKTHSCRPAKNHRDYLWPICFSSFSQYSTSLSYFSVVSPCSGRQRLNGCSFVALP